MWVILFWTGEGAINLSYCAGPRLYLRTTLQACDFKDSETRRMALAPPIAAESLHAKERLSADDDPVLVPRPVRCWLSDYARVDAAFIEANEAKPCSDELWQEQRAVLQREDRIDARILSATPASTIPR